jgi:hypothetical protein
MAIGGGSIEGLRLSVSETFSIKGRSTTGASSGIAPSALEKSGGVGAVCINSLTKSSNCCDEPGERGFIDRYLNIGLGRLVFVNDVGSLAACMYHVYRIRTS